MRPTRLEGARTHNLKGVNLELRGGEVVVLTGPSGAGKSSLALDTLYAEGQRRFIESFSPYARQFLERLERPPMDRLEPVAAGIAVDRRAPIKGSRSTVSTMADLAPYLAALFAREARPLCSEHGLEAVWLDAPTAAARVIQAHHGSRALLGFALLARDTETFLEARERLLRDGFHRLFVDGALARLEELAPSAVLGASRPPLVVVDRLVLDARAETRLIAALETAWTRGDGTAELALLEATGEAIEPERLRRGLGCPVCAKPLDPPELRLFSHDSPLGACSACHGFGRVIGLDLAKVLPDGRLTLAGGAIRPWCGKSASWERRALRELAERHGIPLDVPWDELSAAAQERVLHGDGDWSKKTFPGVAGWFKWLETRAYKMHVRVFLARYRSYERCTVCQGARLNEKALGYRVGGLSLATWVELEISAAVRKLGELVLSTKQGEMARRELSTRLGYLERAGLGYLTLDRQARTLSGGEAQRVTLTAALGTSLHNALFVLDEPTIGLHPRDVAGLTSMFRELAERGNVVLIVEHDPTVILAADRILELGPGAGEQGGMLVADAPPAQLPKTSRTAQALAARGTDARKTAPRRATGALRLTGVREHNLCNLDIELPLGLLVAVAGRSGSGKSTLVNDVLYRTLARHFGVRDVPPAGAHSGMTGQEALLGIELVDQSPLGRTSRGNAATYTGAWDRVRKLFAAEPSAVQQGLGPGHFSFNVAGGRCDACAGEGAETVEMQFLADVRLGCAVCGGKRFKSEVLRIHHRGLDISEVLAASVTEVLALFEGDAEFLRRLGPLERLGLGYLRIGQPLSTLSGGEAQRLKLARALGKPARGTLFILDEPSAGLDAVEVRHVLAALDGLLAGGGSVVVVEHDLDVLRAADWVLELGPGAGREGGKLVAATTPSELATLDTATGLALRGAPFAAESPCDAAPSEHRAEIVVDHAREHNLQDVSVRIPHGALTVVTGPSGSGKSSLAFDVVFAEGQRRFLETLTPYARQFLPTMPRADVDRVTGLPPSIALEQRTSRAGAQSTVATVTEVAHYLRLAFAKLGVAHCPEHQAPITALDAEALLARLRKRKDRFALLAPVVRARKGTHLDVFTAAARAGLLAARADGARVSTDVPPRLKRNAEHTLELVIAEGLTGREVTRALLDQALAWGKGALIVEGGSGDELLSTERACGQCGASVPELDPRWFSFNTTQGRCARCEGAGVVEAGSAAPRGAAAGRASRSKGTKRTAKRAKRSVKRKAATASELVPCPDCAGTRLAPIPRAVRLLGSGYADVLALPVGRAVRELGKWRFSGSERAIAEPILKELLRRLTFLRDVGLGYLALDRPARTLSGGELQRLRLAAQLGAGLTGALYVLDEPTIGLHPRDTEKLLENLRALVDLGSTALVVEHDLDTIRAADHVIDLGPSGGTGGGRVLAEGSPSEVLRSAESPTARALGSRAELRRARPTAGEPRLRLEGATLHNLKNVSLELVLGRLNVIAGVSGSGKSTLIRQVLLPTLLAEFSGAKRADLATLSVPASLRRALAVDQSPIGRTPRSVPATFLELWGDLRALLAATPDARAAGFSAARFSFNTPAGGRCAACEGQGIVTHEMSFLPDVVTPCPACAGLRFEPSTLAVRYRGLSVGDILQLTAAQAREVFASHSRIARPLDTLVELGAGYIHLGQGSHTLSGGEAQRLKLAAELTAGSRHEPTLYVLDEPTTGLHLRDVARLMSVLDRLLDRGDTVVAIEHHPEVLAGADWLVELGPEGGEQGGRIVACGPPAVVAKRNTATGAVLRRLPPGISAS